MGDTRFQRHYEYVAQSRDRATAIRQLDDDSVLEALAAAARKQDPLMANVLATEALNRMRRVKAVTTSLPEGILAIDTNGCVLFVNDAALRLLKRARDELVGNPFAECVPLLDLESRALGDLPVRESFRTDSGSWGDVRIVRGDGSTFIASYVASPLIREGETVGVILSLRDATARRERERDAMAREQRYRAVLDALPDLVLTISLTGDVAMASEASRALLGYEPWELCGRRCSGFLHPEDRDRLEAARRRALQGGGPWDLQMRAYRKDGSIALVEARGSPLHDPRSGAVTEFVCVVRELGPSDVSMVEP